MKPKIRAYSYKYYDWLAMYSLTLSEYLTNASIRDGIFFSNMGDIGKYRYENKSLN